jgi:23S rRNA pseudouridine1911/1915/1917 synthase
MGGAADGHDNERRAFVLVDADGGRADAIVAAALPQFSRARIQRLIASGAISVDGAPLKKSTVLQVGQQVVVHLPVEPDLLGESPPGPLPLLYEDAHVVALDKPAGITAHAGGGDSSPTVAAWFARAYPALAAALDPARPGIVHRLDRDTTGVLVLGKTPAAVTALSRAFEHREVDKTYLAICEGVPAQPQAIIDAPIARHPADRARMGVVRDGTGRAARTRYEVLDVHEGRSFLLVQPESGRTHQVRVHLAAIGVPVLFDPLYGTAGEGRHQLHAYRIVVPHPAGGRLTVTAPMPRDMAAIVRSMGLDGLASEYESAVAPVLSLEP